MTHPEELLSGYVDGTLAQEERAVVDAHVTTCSLCREEVELAREAVAALESLEEHPVPFGVTGPVLAEAGRRFERHRAIWGRVQWAAGLAAAAAVVVVVALNVPGDSGDRAAPADGVAEAGAEAPAAASAADRAIPRLELQRAATYDDAGIQSLALGAGERSELTFGESSPTVESDAGGGASFASRAERRVAVDCLRTSGAPLDDARDQLVRLIEAQYQGTPAFFAVFLETPGGGQPPDSAIVWVAATGDCRILTIASLTL